VFPDQALLPASSLLGRSKRTNSSDIVSFYHVSLSKEKIIVYTQLSVFVRHHGFYRFLLRGSQTDSAGVVGQLAAGYICQPKTIPFREQNSGASSCSLRLVHMEILPCNMNIGAGFLARCRESLINRSRIIEDDRGTHRIFEALKYDCGIYITKRFRFNRGNPQQIGP
jgi:hypothetical protein